MKQLTQEQEQGLKSLKILHVEDDPQIAQQMQILLGKYVANIVHESNGEIAWQRYQRETGIDVVITDVRMPDLDGVKLAHNIRQLSPEQHLIIVSSTEDANEIIELVNLGVNHFVPKPIDFYSLLSHLADYSLISRYQLSLEAKNQALQDTLNELRETQDQLLESKKIASLTELVYGVAHELNTPVGICVTLSSYMHEQISHIQAQFQQQKLTQSDMAEFLSNGIESMDLLGNNLRRLSSLISIFKRFSLEEHNEPKVEIFPLSLIQSLIETYEQTLSERHIKVEISGDSHLKIDSYPNGLTEVIRQLMNNALEHGFDATSSPAHISIRVTANQEHCMIEFKDNGKGIDDKHSAQIFHPFFTTARVKGNAGLGLSLAYNLVNQKLGGQIHLNAQPQGAGFSVLLPIH